MSAGKIQVPSGGAPAAADVAARTAAAPPRSDVETCALLEKRLPKGELGHTKLFEAASIVPRRGFRGFDVGALQRVDDDVIPPPPP